MQSLSDHILEKLNLSNAPIQKNEDILVLEPTYINTKEKGYDLGLFITGLENLSKDYNTNDLIISADIKDTLEYLTVFNKHGRNPNTFKLALGDMKLKLTEIVLYDTSPADRLLKNIVPTILETLKGAVKHKHIKYFQYTFTGHFFTRVRYIYLWYSYENNSLQMHFSDTPYKELFDDEKFI